MSYWGGVLDNIKKVIMRGDISEISLICPLLKSGYEMLEKTKNLSLDNDDASFNNVNIRQNNFGRDATVNLGAIQATTTM